VIDDTTDEVVYDAILNIQQHVTLGTIDSHHQKFDFLNFSPQKSCKEYLSELCEHLQSPKMEKIFKEALAWQENFPFKENYSKLTSDEILALGVFTWKIPSESENFHFWINQVLLDKDNSEKLKIWEGFLYFLQKSFEKLPTIQATGYYAIHESAHVQCYETGTCLAWRGYSVISTNLEKTSEIAGKNGVVLIIQVMNGKSLKNYSAHTKEEELLLSPNVKFFVSKGFYTKNGIMQVELVQDKQKDGTFF